MDPLQIMATQMIPMPECVNAEETRQHQLSPFRMRRWRKWHWPEYHNKVSWRWRTRWQGRSRQGGRPEWWTPGYLTCCWRRWMAGSTEAVVCGCRSDSLHRSRPPLGSPSQTWPRKGKVFSFFLLLACFATESTISICCLWDTCITIFSLAWSLVTVCSKIIFYKESNWG